MILHNLSHSLCEYADAIYVDSEWMQISLFFQLIAGILALICSALLTISVVFAATLHFNVRILMICFCTAVMVANIGILLQSIYFLSVIYLCTLSATERCQMLLFNQADCSGLKSVYHTGALTVILSTIFLAAERILATVKYQSYEQKPLRWVGVLLAMIQCFMWFPIVFNITKIPVFDIELPYCAPELYNPSGSRKIQLFIVAIQLVALSIFIVLWHHNHQRVGFYQFQNVVNPLSARFQLRENVATTRLMMPIVILNTFMLFAHLIQLNFAMPTFHASRRAPLNTKALIQIANYAPIAELQTCLWPIFTFALFYLLPNYGIHIRKSLGKIGMVSSCCNKKIDESLVDVFGIETTQNTYFEDKVKKLGNFGIKKKEGDGQVDK